MKPLHSCRCTIFPRIAHSEQGFGVLIIKYGLHVRQHIRMHWICRVPPQPRWDLAVLRAFTRAPRLQKSPEQQVLNPQQSCELLHSWQDESTHTCVMAPHVVAATSCPRVASRAAMLLSNLKSTLVALQSSTNLEEKSGAPQSKGQGSNKGVATSFVIGRQSSVYTAHQEMLPSLKTNTPNLLTTCPVQAGGGAAGWQPLQTSPLHRRPSCKVKEKISSSQVPTIYVLLNPWRVLVNKASRRLLLLLLFLLLRTKKTPTHMQAAKRASKSSTGQICAHSARVVGSPHNCLQNSRDDTWATAGANCQQQVASSLRDQGAHAAKRFLSRPATSLILQLRVIGANPSILQLVLPCHVPGTTQSTQHMPYFKNVVPTRPRSPNEICSAWWYSIDVGSPGRGEIIHLVVEQDACMEAQRQASFAKLVGKYGNWPFKSVPALHICCTEASY